MALRTTNIRPINAKTVVRHLRAPTTPSEEVAQILDGLFAIKDEVTDLREQFDLLTLERNRLRDIVENLQQHNTKIARDYNVLREHVAHLTEITTAPSPDNLLFLQQQVQ